MKIAVATGNPGKMKEIRGLVGPIGIEVASLADLGVPQVEETGASFEENALQKASALAEASGLWALADDSGLEVDALSGAPGIYSARYAGADASDEANNWKLLAAMKGVPDSRRGAQFRCVLALVSPDRRTWTTEGVCRGRIAVAPRGSGGFGYDPLFLPDGHGETFAEMRPDVKSSMSHRGIALRKMVSVLASIRGLQSEPTA